MAILMYTEGSTAEREMLVRFCARYTSNPDAAEDLAQQALLEAWQHEAELRDPRARRSWLLSIARNQCLMWARGHMRERERRGSLYEESEPDAFDLEIDLDRSELATLLDRAMALLPPDVRDVLIHRYIEESPQAEVAARLGLTEGAVEARLHRGKLALRRVLTTTLGDEAASFGLIAPEAVGRVQTRLWCPGCGRRKLEGVLRSEEGHLHLSCPNCSHTPSDNYINSQIGKELHGIKTFRLALSRVLACIHQMYRVEAADGGLRCGCGDWVPLRHGGEDEMWSSYLRCDHCGWADLETWHSLTWSLPESRSFYREHGRVRFMPEREVEHAGSPAVVTGFESLTDGSRLEVVTVRDSLRVVHIAGVPTAR